MTATMDSAPPKAAFQGLWRRKLDHYPNTRPRMVYLAIVVLATIVLYYQYYVPGAVSPSIIAHFGMTFPYYVYIVVAGNAVGAFGSLVAGLADRWGRANLVAYGLVIVGLLVTFALPNAGSKLTYGICFSLVAIVEGVILVATPALVRDFSPQLGRATAMGFWTLGPVIGSLVLAGDRDDDHLRQLRRLSAYQLLHVRRGDQRLGRLPGDRVRAVDGELHRDRGAAQPGARRDRARHLSSCSGLPPTWCRPGLARGRRLGGLGALEGC